MIKLDNFLRIRITTAEAEKLKGICNRKHKTVSETVRSLIQQYITANEAVPLYNAAEWVALFEKGNGMPELYVNVQSFRAEIIYRKKNITEDIPNGESLAEEAVDLSGGTISRSGVYPPTNVIAEEVKKLEAD